MQVSYHSKEFFMDTKLNSNLHFPNKKRDNQNVINNSEWNINWTERNVCLNINSGMNETFKC